MTKNITSDWGNLVPGTILLVDGKYKIFSRFYNHHSIDSSLSFRDGTIKRLTNNNITVEIVFKDGDLIGREFTKKSSSGTMILIKNVTNEYNNKIYSYPVNDFFDKFTPCVQIGDIINDGDVITKDGKTFKIILEEVFIPKFEFGDYIKELECVVIGCYHSTTSGFLYEVLYKDKSKKTLHEDYLLHVINNE